MNNKLIVTISVPIIDVKFDLGIPNIIKVGSLKKNIIEHINHNYNNVLNNNSLRLIERDSGVELDSNMLIKDTIVCNGSTLVLI